jgi:hypothetical protein
MRIASAFARHLNRDAEALGSVASHPTRLRRLEVRPLEYGESEHGFPPIVTPIRRTKVKPMNSQQPPVFPVGTQSCAANSQLKIDADLVGNRLTEALANLRFWVMPQRDPRIFELVGFAPSADRCITLPIKLVRAASAATGQDEWWVQTAIPFGASKHRLKRARNELHELNTGPLPSNFER